jgi:hypothetical protein
MLKLARLLLALFVATTGSLAPAQARMGFDNYGSGRLTMPSARGLANRYIPSAALWTPAAFGSARVVDFARQANGSYVDLAGSGHTFTGPDANGQYATDAGWTLAQPFTVIDIFDNAASPNPYQISFAGDASPGASGSRAIVFERFNGGAPQLLGGSGNASFGTTLSASASHTLVATFNGASSFGAIDGVQYSGLSTGTSGITNGFRTGGGDSGSFYNGTLKRRIVVQGVISADDERRVEGFGAYNGGGPLLVSHPFYSSAPILGAAIPAVRGTTVAQIAPGSNVARLGSYSGYAATNPDGSSAIPPTPALFGKPVTTHKVFSSNSAQAWSGSTANGETVESSITYALSLLKGRGLQINLTIALATGSGPYYQFPGMALTDVASGAADTMFANVAHYLIDNGFANDPTKPVLVAYAQEQNGNGFPWASDGSALWNTRYIAAARRQHDVMAPIFAAAGKPVMFGMAWNKGKPDLPWQDLAANYVGDAYCDFVGMDTYDDDANYNLPQGYAGATGGNTAQTPAQRFQTSVIGLPDGSTGHLLAWLDNFARTPNMRGPGFIDGKALPIIMGEWAAGGPASIADNDNTRSLALKQAWAGNDDGTYVAGMMQWFKDHFVYAHYFYDIFDSGLGYTGAVKWTPANTNMATAGYASTTAQPIGTGSKTYTVASGLPFQVGMPLIVRDDAAANSNYIEATVSAYSGSTLVVNGFASAGSGSPSAVHILTHPNAVMPNSYAAIKAAQ